MAFPFDAGFHNGFGIQSMRKSLRPAFHFMLAALLLAGCASPHPRYFIPNGAGVDLGPTNPAHIQVLESVPRGMVIGTVLVDRAKAKNTAGIIETAREEAAAVGGDFIVWEDSLGTLPTATPTPGEPAAPNTDSGELGHSSSLPPPPEETSEKSPKARFTVGIFLQGDSGAGSQ
jgi:hypothetical protein